LGGSSQELLGRQFPHQPQPPHPQQEHVVGVFLGPLVGRHPAQAGGVSQRGPALLLLFGPGSEQAHRDQPVILHRLLEHRPIPRLENVQRLHDVGEHHEVWQREDPRQAGKMLG